MKHVITTEKILSAANKWPQAKEALKEICPEIFRLEYHPGQIIIMEDIDEPLMIIKRLESEDKFGLFSLDHANYLYDMDKSIGTFEHCIEFAEECGTIYAFDRLDDFNKFMANYYKNI